MALFEKKKSQEEPAGNPVIPGAGDCIVSRSVLEGTAKLKWMFREDSGLGNGWVAFGDTDTQEYVNNADNLKVVDFNSLIAIEPAVFNIFHLPVGADLEFRCDKTGRYFVDVQTGEEIRERVKHPMEEAFGRNLKFLNQKEYPKEFFQGLFEKSEKITPFTAGETDFSSGEVVLADPLAYLGSEYTTVLERKIPAGSYPVELSVCCSRVAGPRIAAARLRIQEKRPVRYEIAMPKGKILEDFGKPRVWTFFGVDAGMACFCDGQAAGEYGDFFAQWERENPDKNKYTHYFEPLFRQSSRENLQVKGLAGSFLQWRLPAAGARIVLFSSGLGDGVYSAYWGLDEGDSPVELVIPFMNPDYF